MMLKAYRNGSWVRGIGSKADDEGSASWLLGRTQCVMSRESGKKRRTLSCLLFSCRVIEAEQGSAWSASQ